MEQDKPNQTNPSAEADFEEVPREELIAERVADAMSVKVASAASDTVASNDGGTGSDVSVQTDSSSAPATTPDSEVLALAEASTGRKFQSKDEFAKYLSNLNSLVGDQAVAKAREAAKVYDALVEKVAAERGESVEETKRALADELIRTRVAVPQKVEVEAPKQAQSPREESKVEHLSAELAKLKEETQRDMLLRKYPQATDIVEDIAIIAKEKGLSYVAALESSPFKTLLELKAREESAKSPVVTSSNRIGIDTKKVQEKASKVLTRGSDDDKIDLVRQFGKSVGL